MPGVCVFSIFFYGNLFPYKQIGCMFETIYIYDYIFDDGQIGLYKQQYSLHIKLICEYAAIFLYYYYYFILFLFIMDAIHSSGDEKQTEN